MNHLLLLCLALLCTGVPQSARASLLVGATRVIHHPAEGDAQVRVSNEGERPLLMQAWIDDGDPDAPVETLDVPYAVTPALERFEPGDQKWLRIRPLATTLPQDRESIYYLNVLGIPTLHHDRDSDAPQLQFAVRNRIKLIHRPTALREYAEQAAQQLTWRLQCTDGRLQLEAANPTPFHISFTHVALRAGMALHTQGRAANGGGGMITPHSTRRFPLGTADCAPDGPLTVQGEWLDDYGGRIPYDAGITH